MLQGKRSGTRATKLAILIGIAVAVAPQLAMAKVTFEQPDDDVFVVFHRDFMGSRHHAIRQATEKAASLCVAAGYTHLKIIHQESQAPQDGLFANASVRARFFLEDGEERIECERNASEKYIEQVPVRLRKKSDRRPGPAANNSAEATAESGSSRPGAGG